MSKEAFLNYCYWRHITFQQMELIAKEKGITDIPSIEEYITYWNSYNEWNKKFNPYTAKELHDF